MRAGKLDRRIDLCRLTKEVKAAGTVTETWLAFASPWAELLQSGSTEAPAAPGEAETVKLGFRIRWRPDLTTADRVEYDGDNFGIVELREIGRRQALELVCERVR